MGKQGPCRHCGVTSTPLWRNGPPEKPVLCNACGSRWRTKGSLTNYTPLHAREPLDSEEFRVSKPKTIYFKHKEQKTYKKRPSNGILEIEHEMTYSGQNFRKMFEGDLSNRSSSGSAMSYTESSAHFGATDAYDFTGSAQSNLLDSLVPSKKRTGVPRSKPSPVEKLTKELFSIMHEQPSYLSISSEEDLLYGCSTPMGSFEIGHGGVLIRGPNTKTVEEESEASSLPINNKSYDINKGYSGLLSFPVHSASKGVCLSNNGVEKLKKSVVQVTQDVKRDKVLPGKVDILRDRDSPLSSIDLKDIATFEVFMKHMTNTEQHQLLRYLPCTDTPECLKNMFQSPQFMEALSCFQKLLLDGVFDLSFLGTNNEESRTLKGHVLLSSRKSKWVEHYQTIKDAKHKEIIGGKRLASMPTSLKCSDLPPPKRLCDHQNQHLQVLKGVMRSPERVPKSADTNLPFVKSLQMDSSEAGSSKVIHDSNGYIDDEAACFSPRSIFASPPDQSSMLVSLQFTDESSDQDLLLDLPYSASFPEAELLRPWNGSTVQSSSPAEGEESLSNIMSSHFNSRNQRHRQ